MFTTRLKKYTPLAIIGFFPGMAASQINVLEEIIVTAQKRDQNIQDVGIAMTAFSGDQLKALGFEGSDEIDAHLPGVQIFDIGSQGITTITIRGVSQNDFSDQNEAPVAVYQDGVYNSFIAGAGFNLFDIDRVEVLRGPQGTLFGRNATGGLVHVHSKPPTVATEGYLEASVGEYGLIAMEGAVSGSLSDSIQGRLSASTRSHDGLIENTIGDDLEEADNVSVRMQLAFELNDRADLLLNLRNTHDNVDASVGFNTERAVFFNGVMTTPLVNNGLVFNPTQAEFEDFCGQFYMVPAALIGSNSDCLFFRDPDPSDPRVTAIDNPGHQKRDHFGATATLTWELGNEVTLVSITDYQAMERDFLDDTDGTSHHLFNFSTDTDSSQWSQEIRLNGGSGSTRWQFGGYYLDIDTDVVTGVNADSMGFNPPFLDFITQNHALQKTRSYAIFGQLEQDFSERWTLIAGLRWGEDEKTLDFNTSCTLTACTALGIAAPGTVQGDGAQEKVTESDYSAKLQLEYNPSEDILWYIGVNRGQKAQGFNAPAIAGITADLVSYAPEVLTSYETGIKSTFFDSRARLNASAFYYDYQDYQAFTLTGLTPTVFNTDAEVTGAEVELTLQPATGWDVIFGASYLDSIAKNVPNQLVGPSINLGDQRTPQSPEWTFNGLVRYGWDTDIGTWSIQTDFNYVDKRFFNTVNHPALSDGAYTIVNARLGFLSSDGHWDASLWVKNINDTEYVTTAFDLTTASGVVVQGINPPRWIGATLAYRF